MVGFHDHRLVALSVLISILAAHAARALSDRLCEARGKAWFAWLVGGATVDGIGTWSMHYTGMLGFRLPIPAQFDWPTVLLSWVVGVIGSAGAFAVLSRSRRRWPRALAAAVLMGGVGISALHYTAMAAMRLQAMEHYDAGLAILSVVLAILLSLLALSVPPVVGEVTAGRPLHAHGFAILRGAANPVMHYTAMSAMSFTPSSQAPDLSHAVSIASIGIFGISIVPVMVLVVALLTSLVDRLQKQKTLLDELFEQAPQAVAWMTADYRIVRVNREFTRLFGYTAQEAVGRRLGDLIVIDELQDEHQRYADRVVRGELLDLEGVRRRKDGSRVHVAILHVPVVVPGGEIEIYAIYRDITKRIQAEQAVRDYAKHLQTLSRRLLEVQESERRHLARELHDEVGQLLTGLRLILAGTSNLLPDEVRIELDQARGIVDELLERIRGLSFELRPAALDELGLVPALLGLFERFAKQTGVLVDFKHEGIDRRLGPEIETTAYRIVQEALTNVARHAGVSAAAVRVWATADTLYVRVEDLGCGFDLDATLAARRTGGLIGMQERVALVGGRLTIHSQPGAGTQLMAELLLRAKQESE